jgi:hypothetical protein
MVRRIHARNTPKEHVVAAMLEKSAVNAAGRESRIHAQSRDAMTMAASTKRIATI